MEKAYSKLTSGVKSASVSLCEIAVALLCGSCSHYPSCLCETLAPLPYGIQTAVCKKPGYGGPDGVEVITCG